MTKCGLRMTKIRFAAVLIGVNLWLISLTVSTCAQTVDGTVTDPKNTPIQNAEVLVKTQNKPVSQTKTDANGKFSIDSGGNETIKITADGFADFEKLLREINLNAPLKIVLEPQNLRENVTISITRTASRLGETPASVVVLDKQNLQTTAAQTFDDKLRQIAGFTLFRRGSGKTSNPTTQGANLRGLSGSGAARTAVLLDGLSINDAFGGWTFWSRIPNVAVEQAEVLRGGASTFYGDSALGGAVNLVTSKPRENQPILRFETSAGTQKTFDGGAFAAGEKRGWNFSLALESFQTAGYVPTAETERGAIDTKANSRHQNVFLTIGKNFSARQPFNQIFVKTNFFGERRDNGTSLTNNRANFRQISGGADAANENFGAFELRAFAEKQIYDQTFSAISNRRNTEILSRRQRVPSQAFGANIFWTKVLNVRHVVSSAGEFRQIRGFSGETIFADSRAGSFVNSGGSQRTFSVFAQDFWRVTKNLNFNFGGRFDFWKNFDAFSVTENLVGGQTNTTNFADNHQKSFSPRVAAIYRINRNFSASAAFSKSFRAPTLNELYRAFRVGNVLTLANENLQAERARTFESGLNFTGWRRKLNLRGNLFETEIFQPVVSITLDAAVSLILRQRQNVGRTRSRGLEFEAEYAPVSRLRFSTALLIVDSRVAEFPVNLPLVGKFLPQIAKRQMTFQAIYEPHPKLTFSAQGRTSAAQFEDDQNTLKLRPLFNLDVFAAAQISKKTQIFAAVENVFDNRYDLGLTPNLTVAAPRFLRIGLRFDLFEK